MGKEAFVSVGQKVRVLPRKWYLENKDEMGNVPVLGFFTAEMARFLGQEVTVASIDNSIGTHFSIEEDDGQHAWTIEMIDLNVHIDSNIRQDIDWDTVDVDSLNRDELIFLANKLEQEVLV